MSIFHSFKMKTWLEILLCLIFYARFYRCEHLPLTDSNVSTEPAFAFGYRIQDDHGNVHSRQETGDHYGNRKGSYGYNDAEGNFHRVSYVADDNGFRVRLMRKDSLSDEKGTDPKATGAHVKLYFFMGPPKHPRPTQPTNSRQSKNKKRFPIMAWKPQPPVVEKYAVPIRVLSSDKSVQKPTSSSKYRGPVYKSRYVVKFAHQADIPRLPRISYPNAVYHYDLPLYKDK